MQATRLWATPVTAGATLLLSVTGILMFFHLDSGLNKVAHEWLSWVFLAGVALHAMVNLGGLKRHLASRRGQALLATFALVTALSFIPLDSKGDGPPFRAPLSALAQVPVATLAEVAGITPEQMLTRLQVAGAPFISLEQSVADVVGPDARAQTEVLGRVFANVRPKAAL
ncbi:MAG: DUF4405 domain-containing protein [Rhodocyclaceae bacterium]|nr:DUF4405 domain-containing protein [Rhodocyclaceae bacterium]